MFRKMRRFNQQITDEECIEVLKNTKRGVLSLIGDDGYPYGVPLVHWYCEEDGKIYFHGAKDGHKNDAIKSCDKACYTVYDEGYREEGEWALNFKSVITFGRISFVEDEEKAKKICIAMVKKFTDDEEFLAKELKFFFPRVQCFEFTPEHMTGKKVKEE
ncbi:pyridoxamine 5'-phosphate oxidase family protein [Butyrivibrio sp. AE2005]|uniref:pyridoxamine 5'-phosphate oxidase family protein n=1 Tax=Butyrivibrio sp. AE2005 TaxID=1496722 RepID=UPI00047DC375|nr:pyridoxamine 5'-phosphate oxidase family protein [Butyrivibrio sp. AE2005]